MTLLPVVYDGVQEPELDIVSIPGLPGLLPQYKLKDHSQWLREVLSHQVPKARIMAFQYDFAKNSPIASWRDLLNQATSLLFSLIHRREGVEARPIIFACYSFGAFILKKVLLIAKEQVEFRSILENTGGIVFLGCLHNESHPNFEELCIKCAAVEFGTMKKHDSVEALRKAEDWNVIKEVMERFRTLSPPCHVRGFFELQPTIYQVGRFSVARKSECLCPKQLSSLGWDSEKLFGVHANHVQLTEYPRRGDEQFFDLFMETLSDLVDAVCPSSSRPAFARSQDPAELSADWSVLHDLNISTSSLNIMSDLDGSQPFSAPRSEGRTCAALASHIPCFVTSPYEQNSDFVGREDILEEIHLQLAPTDSATPAQRTFALAGLGGMGKTQIAVEYAFRHSSTYRVILLAHADGQAKLAESFCLFAKALGLSVSENLSPSIAKQLVKDFLGLLDADWLMIFDNADGDEKENLLKEYWPKAKRGSVFVTTRDFRLIGQLGGIELTVLDQENAVSLLLNLTKFKSSKIPDDQVEEEITAATKLVKRIDYLPLGISQAANLILNDSCLYSDFLDAYNNRELIEDSEEVRLINHGSMYQYSLRTVWNMNFDRLADEPQRLLELMSFLDPDRIQMRLLTDGPLEARDPELAFVGTPYKRNKCRVALRQSSLVTQSDKLRELRMHRLVQASCHLRMRLDERRKSFKNALTLVKNCWPIPQRTAIYDPSMWEDQQALLPHVQALCAHYVTSCQQGEPLIPQDETDWDFASVLYEAGWYCYERGLLDLIYDLLLPAEKYCLRHLDVGGGYKILADIYGGIGSLHTESNKFEEAYDSFLKEWKYLELAFQFGELEKPSIWEVYGYGRLANGLHGLNRYEEAEEYYQKSLKAWEGIPGDRTVYTTNLATCLWLQGKLGQAEALLHSVIKDRNDATNFRTGYALLALGNVQIGQAQALTRDGKKDKANAKFAEAEESHIQAMTLYSHTLGPRHHRTADTFHKIGWHFHRRHEYEKALNILGQALEVYNSSPGLLKNEIARTRYKRGCVYQDMGDRDKGGQEIREAEKMRQEIVPPEKWVPASGEEDFDAIVQFWTR